MQDTDTGAPAGKTNHYKLLPVAIAVFLIMSSFLPGKVKNTAPLPVKSTGKFEVFYNPGDNKYYFRLKAGNGEPILDSEGYNSRKACRKGVESVQKNAPLDERYERKGSERQWSFTLNSARGELIGKSQDYTTVAAREKGIQSVKNNASTEKIVDMTGE